jgi:hypothetical protein
MAENTIFYKLVLFAHSYYNNVSFVRMREAPPLPVDNFGAAKALCGKGVKICYRGRR